MPKSSKLVASKGDGVLLVLVAEMDCGCLLEGGNAWREIKGGVPKLKVGKLKLWKDVRSENKYSGRKMSDAIFLAEKVTGDLVIGDEVELDRVGRYKPRGIRLTPTSRYIRDKLFPRRSKGKSKSGPMK